MNCHPVLPEEELRTVSGRVLHHSESSRERQNDKAEKEPSMRREPHAEHR